MHMVGMEIAALFGEGEYEVGAYVLEQTNQHERDLVGGVLDEGCRVFVGFGAEHTGIAEIEETHIGDAEDGSGVSQFALAHFADQHLFGAAAAYALQPAGMQTLFAGMSQEQLGPFVEDRKRMREGGNAARLPLPQAWGMLLALLPRIDAQLSDGRRFLDGDHARICDFSTYHPLWFVQRAGEVAAILEPYPHLRGWMGRVAAFGHGSPQPMSAAEALEVARRATPGMLAGRSLREVDGVGVGDTVSVVPVDYGIDPVTGTLANAEVDSFSVRRVDERVGEVVVHFPRLGFRIAKA